MIQLPESYKGREHSFIKHQILEAYLKRLFMIIGLSQSTINYVDCFSGPWQDDSENLDSSSIGIALRIMQNYQNPLKILNRGHVKFRALFIEKDRKAYKKLSEFLASHYPDIETHSINGEFANVRSEILNWCQTKPFTFFFIDPKGWKDMGQPTLQPLLRRPNSEFLINFMYEFLNRAVNQEPFEDIITELLGHVPDLDKLTSKERENYIVRLYRDTLKQATQTKNKNIWTARARILRSDKDRAIYHLIYLTKHPKGMEVFMDASEKLDIVQKQIHLATKINAKIEKTKIEDIFANTENHIKTEQNIDDVKAYWLKHISTTPRQFTLEDLANFLEETDWMPSDFQLALGELIENGLVQNLDTKRKRPKNHIKFEDNEKLVRV